MAAPGCPPEDAIVSLLAVGWTGEHPRVDCPRFKLEFYQSLDGDEPVHRWMEHRLSVTQRRALDAALRLLLAAHGVDVCNSRYGRHLGGGLFEFRLDEDEGQLLRKWDPDSQSAQASRVGERILLRVFCHAAGSGVIMLLGGYDKGRDPSQSKQQREIAQARRRLEDFLRRRHTPGYPDP